MPTPPIALDHIFTCCDPGAPEAQALLDIGLKEGSGNHHPGQGTANRRFFFHDGFIELLWVSDAAEAQSPLTAPTRLWPRWSGRRSDACPFGIAFSPSGSEVPDPPFATWPYRPQYLPQDKSILFAEGTSLQEPELFYMAWPYPLASSAGQPKDHEAPLVRLLSVSVGLPPGTQPSAALCTARTEGWLGTHTSDDFELKLKFESTQAVTFDLRASLGLVLQGVPGNSAPANGHGEPPCPQQQHDGQPKRGPESQKQ